MGKVSNREKQEGHRALGETKALNTSLLTLPWVPQGAGGETGYGRGNGAQNSGPPGLDSALPTQSLGKFWRTGVGSANTVEVSNDDLSLRISAVWRITQGPAGPFDTGFWVLQLALKTCVSTKQHGWPRTSFLGSGSNCSQSSRSIVSLFLDREGEGTGGGTEAWVLGTAASCLAKNL